MSDRTIGNTLKGLDAREATIVKGDSLDLMSRLASESIDLVFADPPYHLSNGGVTVSGGKLVPVDKGDWDASGGFSEDVNFHRQWIAESYRVLRPSGTIFVSGTYHSIYRCGFVLEEAGFVILNDVAWFKPNASPNLTRRNFAAAHETLIWAAKTKNSGHAFDYEAMKAWDGTGDSLKNVGKQMRSVWGIPTTPAREKRHGSHPTQKPLALLRRIVAAASKPGDLVFDPFLGSGSSGVAAVESGRRFLGFEKSDTYVELASRRISEALEALF